MGVPVLTPSSRARHAVLGLGLVAGAAVASPTPSPPPTPPPVSPRVTRVEVRSETPVDADEVAPLVSVRPGEPLADEAVAQTLRNLRLSGLAAEVELWTRPSADGVEALLVLRPDVWVTSVEVEGETGLEPRVLREAAPQRPGRPLREDRVVRGVYALQEALAAQGYRRASVRVEVAVEPETRRARVVYRVAAGDRSIVGAVRVEGLDGRLPEAEAVGSLRVRPGEPLRTSLVRDDTERLQRFLVERGFRRAVVEAAQERPGEANNVVDLAWNVRLGPHVELVLVGAERRELERRGLLGFLGEAGYDEALVAQSVGQIRAYYQEKGHYDVVVRSTEETAGDRVVQRIEIETGEKWTLDELGFEGNEAFSDERLARLMKTTPRRLLAPGSGRLVDAVLAEDLSNLRSFYVLEGFDRVRVDPPRIERRAGRLALTVPVEEGPKRSVVEVRLEGLTAFDVERTLRDLPLHAGGPFHRLLVESSAERVRSRLEDLGYRSAIVSPEIEWSGDKTVARVTLRVLEGERSTAEAILVRGNTRTDTGVLRRFHGLSPGDPISTRALLDVQRQLYRLGVFSRVDVTVPPVGVGPATREVLIEVEEGRTRSVAYGAGYDSESGARGLVRLSESNLLGRLVTVQLDALISQRDELYRLLARQPYLGPWPLESRVLAYREAEDRPSFDVSRRGLQVGLERAFDRRRIGLTYDYRLVDLVTDEPESVIPRESREARVASLTPSFFWDRRDDPIDPTRGWSALALFERAFPAFDADADFDKTFLQGTGYLPLDRSGVVALALRAGVIRPHGQPEDPGLDPFDLVPSAERFYAGGRTTHRAFARDDLGVPGETLFVEEGEDPVPLGGGALALLNVEWRFPLAGGFGGSVFVDGGNVWREAGDVDFDDVRWGAGVGLRYLSPVGPLRLEIGWKLDRQPLEDPFEWFISLGNPF